MGLIFILTNPSPILITRGRKILRSLNFEGTIEYNMLRMLNIISFYHHIGRQLDGWEKFFYLFFFNAFLVLMKIIVKPTKPKPRIPIGAKPAIFPSMFGGSSVF